MSQQPKKVQHFRSPGLTSSGFAVLNEAEHVWIIIFFYTVHKRKVKSSEESFFIGVLAKSRAWAKMLSSNIAHNFTSYG